MRLAHLSPRGGLQLVHLHHFDFDLVTRMDLDNTELVLDLNYDVRK